MATSWSVVARTEDAIELRFEWREGPVMSQGAGPMLARMRCQDPTPVRATPTGPFAPPSLGGESWVAYCTVLEAFSRTVPMRAIRSEGDPGFPEAMRERRAPSTVY